MLCLLMKYASRTSFLQIEKENGFQLGKQYSFFHILNFSLTKLCGYLWQNRKSSFSVVLKLHIIAYFLKIQSISD